MATTFSKHIPWTLLFFAPILYFTLFDQPGFIPSVKPFVIGLVLLAFIPWLLVKIWQRAPLPVTPLDGLFPAVVILHLVSASLSPSFRLTFYNLWLVLLSILIFYFTLDQFKAGREDSLWKAMFLVAALVLELALLEFFAWYLGLLPQLGFEVSWPEVAGWTLPPSPRRLGLALITVPVSPPFSAYVALFIPLALGLAASTRRFSIRLGFAGFILLSSIILLLTFSRTGLITLVVGLITFVLLTWFTSQQTHVQPGNLAPSSFSRAIGRVKGLRKKWFTLAVAITIVIFFIGLFLNRAYLANEIFENRGGSNQIRLSLIKAAILMWQEHPLFGMGPGLFGAFYRNYIAPNSFFLISLSTHSFYFQMLAEEGIAGLLMAAIIFIVSSQSVYQYLLAVKDPAQQWRLIGVTSALITYFTSAAIEQLWWPAFIIPVCLMAAYLFYRPAQSLTTQAVLLPGEVIPNSNRQQYFTPNRLRLWLPSLYLVLLIVFGVTLFYIDTIATSFLELTEEVKPGQELAVAQALSQLQRFDPGLPSYTVGQAYYHGRHVIEALAVTPCTLPPTYIAETEKMILDRAISLYEQGLQPIKAHPLYWANLASLYWLNRQPDAAQAALAQAINLSSTDDPKIDIYLLNSGCYYELQGDASAAITAYSRLLARNPLLVSSAFWRASAFRVKHLPQIIDVTRQHFTDPQQQLLVAITLELAQNQAETAEIYLDRLAAAFPDSSNTLLLRAKKFLKQNKYQESWALAAQMEDYQLLGEIGLASGDTTAAEINFKKALFIASDNPEARFHLAQTALAEGNTATAITYLKRLTPAYTPPTTLDSKFVYGYPTHFPIYDSLLIITSPPLQGQPFDLLAQLYEEAGDTESAEEVRGALLTYDPYLKN
jgi:tetratricopeptide (TPR) repeat protein/O-antigen ligase